MSFEDDQKRKEQSSLTRDKVLTTPNLRQEMQRQTEALQRKELVKLKEQVERSKLQRETAAVKNETKEGTGGRKKDDVVTADAKATPEGHIKQEQLQKLVEQQQGTTEKTGNLP